MAIAKIAPLLAPTVEGFLAVQAAVFLRLERGCNGGGVPLPVRRKFGRRFGCAYFLRWLAVSLNRPFRDENVGVIVPGIAVAVRRMNGDVGHQAAPHESLPDEIRH
jgi:hypothetical protein